MYLMNENLIKIEKIIKDKNLNGQIVISIDGPCGAGKTTIAKSMEEEYSYNITVFSSLFKKILCSCK